MKFFIFINLIFIYSTYSSSSEGLVNIFAIFVFFYRKCKNNSNRINLPIISSISTNESLVEESLLISFIDDKAENAENPIDRSRNP